MTIAPNPTYRNIRKNFYTDKSSDTTEVGTIISTMKAVTDVHDNSLVPTTPSYDFSTGQITRETAGNAQTDINPEYQYPGYIYCDGSEYKIEDYPALYKIIGNDYGGTSRPGLELVNGGSGYPTTGNVTITFSAPTGNANDNQTIEAQLSINAAGVITSVITTALGKNYTSDPTYTLQNAGTGSGLQLKFNFNSDGELENIKPTNVFEYLGEHLGTGAKTLGTFMVPDLKSKKILGYGTVYGTGSPTAGLLTLGAGAEDGVAKTGGKWLFDKTAQGGYFSLGTITTTEYEKVTDAVGTTIAGTQTVKVSMQNKRLQGVPQHNHFVYHTVAGSSVVSLAGYSGDRYLSEYTNGNTRLFQFFPIGGIAYAHKHALLKQPLTGAGDVATYDILDFYPGAEGTGSYKSNTATTPAINKTGGASGVSPVTDTISLTSHGFSTGDEVTYTVGSVVKDITLSDINLGNDTMTVVNHSWTTGDQTTYGKGVITFTINSGTAGSTPIDVTNDRIELIAHGQPTGTPIKYTTSSGTPIEGITIGFTYYLRVVDANTVTLHTTPGNASVGTPTVDLTSIGTGSHTFTVEGAVATPLIDNQDYFVIVVDTNTIKLAVNATNAIAGTAINITDVGSGVHTLTSPGTAISPLANASKYYIIKVDNDTIKLANSTVDAQGGNAINLLDSGLGSFILSRAAVAGEGYYMASGGAGAGTYEVVTNVPPPVFKKFTSTSVVGGRQTTTGGVPIIEYPDGLITKSTPQTGTGITFPSNWTTLVMTITGGGGSGSPGNQSGNSGGASKIEFGGGLLTITANGGQAGGLNTARTDGGQGGSVTKTGTKVGDLQVISESQGAAGTNGNAGTYWKKGYPTTPNVAGDGGDNAGSYTNDGTDGLHTLISDTNNPGSSGNQTGSGSISISSTNYSYTSIQITLAGATGGDANQLKAACSQVGGNGDVMVLEVSNPVNGFNATYVTGTKGGNNKTGGTGAYGANGGTGGNKNGSGTNGAGGGGASAMKMGQSIVAGAGGGGGSGGTDGAGGGGCGVSGGSNNTSGWASDNAQSTTANLFPGGGSGGQNAGCNGGGGGGGGGGVATANYGSGTGSGGGAGAGAGHGGGYGGGRGMSSFKSSIFTKIQQSNSSTGDGYISWTWNEDRSYWTNGGGGGGAGGRIYATIEADNIGSNVSATLDVGAGGTGQGGVSSGGGGAVVYGFGVITGYEGGETTTSVGDIVINASGTDSSNGPEIYVSGTGTGNSGGFKLPTTQVPEVEVVTGTTGGSGAAATVALANGFVSSITKTNNGSNYQSAPEVRIKHGAGSGAYAVATVNNAQEVDTISLSTLVTPSAYDYYIKIGGAPSGTGATDYHRWITLKEHDCTNVKRFSIKCARGNGSNGGDLPEQGGDVLKLYYNTDLSDNFNNLIGVIVPLPTNSEVSSKYDGDGTGTDATKWYWYSMDLPSGAQTATTRFHIKQERPVASGTNDSGSNTDHYGICDFIYEYKAVSGLTFVPSDGSISTNSDELTYVVEGNEASIYTSGATGLDCTFTLNSQNPLVPVPLIDPDFPVPVVEPYHLCKYLIKAF